MPLGPFEFGFKYMLRQIQDGVHCHLTMSAIHRDQLHVTFDVIDNYPMGSIIYVK